MQVGRLLQLFSLLLVVLLAQFTSAQYYREENFVPGLSKRASFFGDDMPAFKGLRGMRGKRMPSMNLKGLRGKRWF